MEPHQSINNRWTFEMTLEKEKNKFARFLPGNKTLRKCHRGIKWWRCNLNMIQFFKIKLKCNGTSILDEKTMTAGVDVFSSGTGIGKRKVGSPQARWNDDHRKMAGSIWMRISLYRVRWRPIGEAYVRQWADMMSSSGLLKTDDDDDF